MPPLFHPNMTCQKKRGGIFVHRSQVYQRIQTRLRKELYSQDCINIENGKEQCPQCDAFDFLSGYVPLKKTDFGIPE